LLDHLRIDRCHLYGQCIGGPFILNLIRAQPERVASAVLAQPIGRVGAMAPGRPARFDGWGRLIRLKDQDRTRWDMKLADEAMAILDRAIGLHRAGAYQVQAAIAALHAQAPCYEQTDWRYIRLLYSRLQQLAPSPVVLLNRAVATRYAISAQAALDEIEPLSADLGGYHLFHALRASLLATLGRPDEAREANERALALAANPAERELLTRGLSL